MEIIVDPISGGSFTIYVSRYLTIMSLKLELQRILGLPIAHQVLIFDQLELDDSRTLWECNIKPGSHIQLLVAMKGGPVHAKRITVPKTLDTKDDCSDAGGVYVDSEELEYLDRLTILLIDGDNFNVIHLESEPTESGWELSALPVISYTYLFFKI